MIHPRFGELRVAKAGPLKVEDRGEGVREMQRALGLPDDGYFSWQVQAAVVRVQRRFDLPPTGEIDGLTAAFIFRLAAAE